MIEYQRIIPADRICDAAFREALAKGVTFASAGAVSCNNIYVRSLRSADFHPGLSTGMGSHRFPEEE